MTYLDYAIYAADIIFAIWFGYALQKYFIKDKTDTKTQLLVVLDVVVYVAVSLYVRHIA